MSGVTYSVKSVQLQRIFIILIISTVLMLTTSYVLVFAESDNTKPTINSITVDETDVEAPGLVGITADLSDDISGIKRASIGFAKQDSGQGQVSTLLKIGEDGKYHGTLNIGKYAVEGTYTFVQLSVDDKAGNSVYYDYLMDATPTKIKDLQFNVINPNGDNTKPTINSITVDETDVEAPGLVGITADLSDDISGIKRASIGFAKQDSGQSQVSTSLNIGEDGKYHGTLNIGEYAVEGTYTFVQLSVDDKAGNSVYYDYLMDATPTKIKDLQFNVHRTLDDISELEQVTVINSNYTLSNVTIENNLYIAPNSILTLSNVDVTGNIYVLGTLRADSITAQTLYAKSIIGNGTAYGNGAASMSGYNSVQSMIIGEKVITDIPLRIDSELLSVNGKLSIKGAYANIATMYINDNQVNATSTGKFYLKDIDVEDATSVTIKFITAENETFTKKYDVVVGTLDKDGNPNGIPVITASDISLCEGADLDLLGGVKANDYEDGDVSSLVNASPNTLSTSEPGKYDVQYSVTDSQGTETTKTIKVEIKSHEWDEGTFVTDATCTKDGQKKYVCANCKKEKTEAIPATGHSFSDEFTTDIEPTCTVEGSKSKHCTKCEEVTEVTAIPAKGHEWSTIPSVDKIATCIEDGSQSIHCAVCGEKDEFTVTDIPKTGHDWNEPTYTWTDDNSSVTGIRTCRNDSSHKESETAKSTSEVTKAATYTEKGETTYTAVFTNKVFTKQTKTVADIPVIERVSIEKATISNIVAKVYTGKALTQTPTIKIGTKTLKSGTDYKLAYKNNKNVGKATVTITGIGAYKDTINKTFKINPKGTSLKTLTKASKAVTVKWTKQATKMSSSRITGYQIQLATDSKFTKNKKLVTVKGYSKVSKKVIGLKGGKKYYVRIRTYKTVNGANFYSSWLKSKTLTTKK